MLEFALLPGHPSVPGRLIYVPQDYALDFRQSGGLGDPPDWSILVNDLQLEVSGTGVVLYAWGYCPLQTFRQVALRPPQTAPGRLLVENASEIASGGGASLRLTQAGEWPGFIDTGSGWLCVGDPYTASAGGSITFANGCVASTRGPQLTSLWLHPENLPGRRSPTVAIIY